MSNTTPLPIVKKCARCGGTHDKMFPDVYCWEETFRMYCNFPIHEVFSMDKNLKEIYYRLLNRYNKSIDSAFESMNKQEQGK